MQRSILIIGTFLSGHGGYRGVCEDLAERLTTRGWSVITASARVGRVSKVADMILTAWRNRRQYRAAQVDVHSGPAFIWAELVCWLLRRTKHPYVLTLHGGDLPMFGQRQPWRVRRLLQSAAAVTTPSRYLLHQMQAFQANLRYLPNALDLTVYPFRLRSRPSARLIWLRSFHEIYNPSLAPQVVSLLSAEFPEIQLSMIGRDKGDGSLQRAQQTVDRLGLQNAVQFVPGVPKQKVPEWLSRGDIFLNTAKIDNTPISVLEAMACGMCIVSTDVGGLPYLLEDGHDGLLAPPGDAAAMARAVRRILTEPALAARLSANARRKALSFDWSLILPQWESLLMSVSTPPAQKSGSV